jgi:hypothetical protein
VALSSSLDVHLSRGNVVIARQSTTPDAKGERRARGALASPATSVLLAPVRLDEP